MMTPLAVGWYGVCMQVYLVEKLAACMLDCLSATIMLNSPYMLFGSATFSTTASSLCYRAWLDGTVVLLKWMWAGGVTVTVRASSQCAT
jgi:hypothetical protein